jgi:WXXGXW repeat (2 copies)
MKTNIVDHTKTVFARNESKTKLKWTALLFFFVFVALGAGGCEGTYTAYPGYGPYYGGYGPYGPGYGPGYAAYPGSVTVEVGDRPYYNRGAGYYVGHSYYVWRPGHWSYRHGQKVWIHGHYVVR